MIANKMKTVLILSELSDGHILDRQKSIVLYITHFCVSFSTTLFIEHLVFGMNQFLF